MGVFCDADDLWFGFIITGIFLNSVFYKLLSEYQVL